MGNDWKELSIDELKSPEKGSIAMGPFGSRIKAENFVNSGVPVLKGGNLHKAFITEDSFDYLTEEKAEELKTSQAVRRDIVITHRGTIGQVSIIPDSSEHEKYIVSQSQLKVTLNQELVNPYFVNYFLHSPLGQYRLLANSSQVGVPAIAQASTSVKSILVPCPELEIQNEIVDILSSLDEKIDLNRKTNQTLENIAQTLFKSWFVDFDPVFDNALAKANNQLENLPADFPDALRPKAEKRLAVLQDKKSDNSLPHPDFPSEFEFDEQLGWIPKGWSVSTVGNEFDVTMGQSPPSSTYNEENEGQPFFQGKTDFGFRFPTNRIYCTSPKRRANKDDTLLSVRAPVGTINLAANDCAIGRGLAAIRHKSGSVSFTYYAMHNLSNHFKVFEGEGTVFGSINQSALKGLLQMEIPQNIVALFDSYCSVWDEKIRLNSEQISGLTQTRDILLPRLISGELSVDNNN